MRLMPRASCTPPLEPMSASSPGAQALPTIEEERLPASIVERWLPSLGLAAALLACLFSPTLATALAPWPFLVAAVVLGLPHCAADGAVLLRGLSWPARLRRIAGYLALMTLSSIALLSFPAPTLLAFLALSWWHFGTADGQGLSNQRNEGFNGLNGRQRDKKEAVLKMTRLDFRYEVCGRSQSQARFAAAANADQGQQPAGRI